MQKRGPIGEMEAKKFCKKLLCSVKCHLLVTARVAIWSEILVEILNRHSTLLYCSTTLLAHAVATCRLVPRSYLPAVVQAVGSQ